MRVGLGWVGRGGRGWVRLRKVGLSSGSLASSVVSEGDIQAESSAHHRLSAANGGSGEGSAIKTRPGASTRSFESVTAGLAHVTPESGGGGGGGDGQNGEPHGGRSADIAFVSISPVALHATSTAMLAAGAGWDGLVPTAAVAGQP